MKPATDATADELRPYRRAAPRILLEEEAPRLLPWAPVLLLLALELALTVAFLIAVDERCISAAGL